MEYGCGIVPFQKNRADGGYHGYKQESTEVVLLELTRGAFHYFSEKVVKN